MAIEIIAEIGANHNRSFDRINELVCTAKDIGCDGVKFQLFHVDKLFRLKKDREKNRANELPHEFIPEIAKLCKDLSLSFGCTPFDIEAVEQLKAYVDFYKISSYELLRHNFIKYVYDTNIRLILSSGMLTFDQLYDLVYKTELSKRSRNLIDILHCVADYPTYPADCNLAVINKYIHSFSGKIGWSDHTRCPGVIYEAIGQGAQIIEFHLDLEDGKGNEFKHLHCWRPSEAESMIKDIRMMEISRGDGNKRLSETEKDNLDKRGDSDGMRPLKN